MNTISKNIFKTFTDRIFELPLWVKQAIYIKLKEEIETHQKSKLNLHKEQQNFQLYVPMLTFLGKRELELREKNLSYEIYKILEESRQKLNIMEIAINNSWNLAEISSFLLDAVDNKLLIKPESSSIVGTALYMSGKIRLGEYFVKIGKISIEQLDEALKLQKYLEETIGDKVGIGDVFIKLGFLNKTDTKTILILKEESQKRYIPDVASNDSEFKDLKEQVTSLTRENNQLKDKINKFLQTD